MDAGAAAVSVAASIGFALALAAVAPAARWSVSSSVSMTVLCRSVNLSLSMVISSLLLRRADISALRLGLAQLLARSAQRFFGLRRRALRSMALLAALRCFKGTPRPGRAPESAATPSLLNYASDAPRRYGCLSSHRRSQPHAAMQKQPERRVSRVRRFGFSTRYGTGPGIPSSYRTGSTRRKIRRLIRFDSFDSIRFDSIRFSFHVANTAVAIYMYRPYIYV